MFFWRRGPTAEAKAEEVKAKRENNDEVFNRFMLCRALSLQSLECYNEHGRDARQCQRSMEEENLCWGQASSSFRPRAHPPSLMAMPCRTGSSCALRLWKRSLAA